MRRATALLFGAILFGSGCSSSGDESQRPPGADTDANTSKYETLAESDLKTIMLTVDDMPTGFAVDPDPSDDDDGDDFTSGDPSCKELVADKDNNVADRDAAFTQGDFGPFVTESVMISKKGTAASSFAEVRDALEGCKSYVAGKGDDATSIRVSRMSFSEMGDETLAYQLTGESSGFPFTGQLAAIRLGDNIVLLSSIGVAGSTLPAKDLEEIANKAVSKVKQKVS